uniref:Protein kinase domain-containing protein n=1 Tax=Panagrellus redivivus TaxID=6233 RepID=A0A7E4VID4_PANRE
MNDTGGDNKRRANTLEGHERLNGMQGTRKPSRKNGAHTFRGIAWHCLPSRRRRQASILNLHEEGKEDLGMKGYARICLLDFWTVAMDEADDLFNRWMDESPFNFDADDHDELEFSLNFDQSTAQKSDSSTSTYIYDDTRSILSENRFGRVSQLPNSPIVPNLPDILGNDNEPDHVFENASISDGTVNDVDDIPYYDIPTLRDLPSTIKDFTAFHGYTTLLYAERLIAESKLGYFYGAVLGEDDDMDFMDLKLFFCEGYTEIFYNHIFCWINGSPQFLSLDELNEWILSNQIRLFGGMHLVEMIPRPASRLTFVQDLSVTAGFWGRMQLNNETVFYKFAVPHPKKYANLYNEAYVLAKLENPHVVQYIGLAKEFACIVMENVGYPLTGYVHNFPNHITPILRLGILRSVAEAMMYLKSKHVVHRNVLPKNIFINDNAVVKLAGFDTSAFQTPSVPGFFKNLPIASRWYHVNTTVDTECICDVNWHFKAPENLMMLEFSFQSDIYQFAMTAYYLFTVGEIPFHFCPEAVHFFTKITLTATAHTWIKFPSTVEKELQKMFHNCIAYRPSKRPIIEDILKAFKELEIKYQTNFLF